MEDRIRELAYRKWEAAGTPPGDGVNFWYEAEAELLCENGECAHTEHQKTPSKKPVAAVKVAAKTSKGNR